MRRLLVATLALSGCAYSHGRVPTRADWAEVGTRSHWPDMAPGDLRGYLEAQAKQAGYRVEWGAERGKTDCANRVLHVPSGATCTLAHEVTHASQADGRCSKWGSRYVFDRAYTATQETEARAAQLYCAVLEGMSETEGYTAARDMVRRLNAPVTEHGYGARVLGRWEPHALRYLDEAVRDAARRMSE